MNSLYTGRIADRLDSVFKEGNWPLLAPLHCGPTAKSPITLLLNAIQSGEKYKRDDGSLWIIFDGYWVHLKADGELEIGEGAA